MIGKLAFYFMSVGNGHSTYIEFPNGQNALVDINTTSGEENPLTFFKAHNISALEYLIITHPHQDHITGLYDLTQQIRIKTFVCSNVYFKPDPVYLDWQQYENLRTNPALSSMRVIARGGVSHTVGGTPFTNSLLGSTMLGGVKITYLAPLIHIRQSLLAAEEINVNDESLVIRLSYGLNRIILCGDTEETGWERIPDTQLKNTTLLLASHHGNDSGYCRRKITAMAPKYVVISAGEGTEYDADNKYRYHTDKWNSPYTAAFGGQPPQRVFTTRTSGVLEVFNSQSLESIANV